jgi:hypothetical protein
MSLAILGLGTATPAHRYTQQETAALLGRVCCSDVRQAAALAALFRQTHIEHRHLAYGPAFVAAAEGQAPGDRGPGTAARMAHYVREALPLALQAARQALAPHVESYPDLLPSFMGLQEALGVAYMRQAEVQNCLVNPGADRCLFPLRPGGIHHRTAGAEAARGLFEAFLARAPADLEVRWLLNLANMVLGRYPGDVPKAHLLPPSVFRSAGRLPRFVDVAPQAHKETG